MADYSSLCKANKPLWIYMGVNRSFNKFNLNAIRNNNRLISQSDGEIEKQMDNKHCILQGSS